MKNRCATRMTTAVMTVLVLFMSLPVHGQETLGTMDLLEAERIFLERVRNAYVDSTIEMSELLNGAFEGMVKKLDPHSSYLPPKTADNFTEKIRGNFSGIGITFSMINDKITVIEVIEDGPSSKVGLKPRDKIVNIDGDSAIGIDKDEVRDRLRGRPGTSVGVRVERPGEDGLMDFTITRDTVDLDSVSNAYMLDDVTGYIAVSQFTIKTRTDVGRALERLGAQGMERLVLDLRNNSGGSLDAAVGVVNFFLNNGVIVSTKGRRPIDNQTWAAGEMEDFPSDTEMPLVVMINHGSASASEIVAGALQDHDRALIVGQTSFGKGLVMNPFSLTSDGGRKNLGTLILSVAHYYTPSDRLIQRPYDNGREDYIREGYDDVDPNAADSTKADRPVYYTDLGRKVYGGGGISPDVVLDRPRTLNEYEKELRGTTLFFEFADGYLDRHDDIPADFETFLTSYRIPADELERFRDFASAGGVTLGDDSPMLEALNGVLDEQGIDNGLPDDVAASFLDAGIDVNETYFDRSEGFVERELKQELARILWGPVERYRVWHTEDTELKAAITYFNDAADLLARRLAIGDL